MFQLDFESYIYQSTTANSANSLESSEEHPVANHDSDEELANAETFLKLGIVYWRRGDFNRSEHLLTKAQEISERYQNVRFLAQCFIALALVKTSLDKDDDAIIAYKQSINLSPENIHLWNNLGMLYQKKGLYKQALDAFKSALKINSYDVIAWNGLATIHYQNGNIEEAINSYKRMIALTQDNSNKNQNIDLKNPTANELFILPWLRLATLFTKKCQYKRAIAAYQKALSLDAGNAEFWNQIGVLYIKIGAYEEAAEAFSNAVEKNPEYGDAYLNLARVYTKLGKYRDSIPIYLKSIEKIPIRQQRMQISRSMERVLCIIRKSNAIDNFINEGSINVGSSHNDVSWFYYKYNEEITSIKFSNPFRNLKHLGTKEDSKLVCENKSNLIRTSNEQHTVEGEGTMPSLFPSPAASSTQSKLDFASTPTEDMNTHVNDPRIWNEKGNIHFISMDYSEAIISYNKAINLDPSFGQPYHNLALIHSIQGNYDESILLYRESIKLLISNQEKAIAWNGLGQVYRCKKDYINARIAYQNASELDKQNECAFEKTIIFEVSEEHKNSEFWNDLGKLLFKTGAYEKAASSFKKAIRLEPSSGYAYSYLARVFSAQGRYKEAALLYRKSINLFPNEKKRADVWNRLGDVYRKLNDYDNALKAYKNATALSKDKSSLLNRARFSLLSNCTAK